MRVLRWGQSAYETDADLALERDAAHALGFSWSAHPDVHSVPDLEGIDLLVVTSKVQVSRDVLAQVPRVLTTTSGYDHIDLDAAKALGVAIGRSPLARRDAVVEHALGALIMLGKRWPDQQRHAEQGSWCRAQLPEIGPLGLRGSTIFLIGLGVIGTKMAEVLRVLDCNVLGLDPRGVPEGVTPVTLEEGLSRCDAVSVHCSLTPSSDDLLDAAALELLQPEAVVVNTARGRSLDVVSAVAAVQQGRLRGLAVDVFPEEPWPALTAANTPGVLFTPHGAGYAPDLGERVAREVSDAMRALADGRPFPHPVEPG